MPTRRMRTEKRRRFRTWQKTIDLAIWLTFKDRAINISYGSKPALGGYKITVIEHENLNEYYSRIHQKISYKDIKAIRQDQDPLPYWEEICGSFSIMDGELLRFILHTDIPFQKFIRYELASRGFDENHQWVGFEKAEQIWLK